VCTRRSRPSPTSFPRPFSAAESHVRTLLVGRRVLATAPRVCPDNRSRSEREQMMAANGNVRTCLRFRSKVSPTSAPPKN